MMPMMPSWLKRKYGVTTLAMIAAVLVLVGLTVYQGVAGYRGQDILTTQPKQIAVPELPTVAQRDFADLSMLQSQALFYQTRSFYTAPVVEQKVAPPDYRLVGTMSMPQKPLVALLVNNQTNQKVKVAKGDDLDGWKVTVIESKKVVIASGDNQHEIGSTTRVAGGVGGQPGIANQSGFGNPSGANSMSPQASAPLVTSGLSLQNNPSGNLSQANPAQGAPGQGGVRMLGSPAANGSQAQGFNGSMPGLPNGASRLYRPPPR